MKPLIIVSVLLICTVLSTALYNKNVVGKQDTIDSFCIGLKPIKDIVSTSSRISFAGDAYHNEFYPISRYYLLPVYIRPYDKTTHNDTLLTVEVSQYPDSTINSILEKRHIIYTNNNNGYIYKLSTSN